MDDYYTKDIVELDGDLTTIISVSYAPDLLLAATVDVDVELESNKNASRISLHLYAESAAALRDALAGALAQINETRRAEQRAAQDAGPQTTDTTPDKAPAGYTPWPGSDEKRSERP